MKMLRLIISALLLLFTASCGYEVVKNSSQLNYSINQLDIKGDNQINSILNKKLINRKNLGNISKSLKLSLITESKTNTTSQDSMGNASSYQLTVEINILVKTNDGREFEKLFTKNTNYNNLNSKFELRQYERTLKKNLTNDIFLEINRYLSSLVE
jgi:hypothetical protein